MVERPIPRRIVREEVIATNVGKAANSMSISPNMIVLARKNKDCSYGILYSISLSLGAIRCFSYIRCH